MKPEIFSQRSKVPVSTLRERASAGTRSPAVGSDRTVVAVFDFDGTLTHCDTLLPFLRIAAGRGRFWGGIARLAPILLGYGMGRLDRTRVKQAVLGHFIAGWPAARLEEAVERFVASVLPALCNADAVERLRWHQGKGHRVLVISASPEDYVRAWAAALNVDAVLATRLEVDDGALTGRLDGENCRGAEKVSRLAHHLGGLDGYEIFAYGDSDGDRELLATSDHPVYRPFRRPGATLYSTLRFLRAVLF